MEVPVSPDVQPIFERPFHSNQSNRWTWDPTCAWHLCGTLHSTIILNLPFNTMQGLSWNKSLFRYPKHVPTSHTGIAGQMPLL
jgi:hypothetical protein